MNIPRSLIIFIVYFFCFSIYAEDIIVFRNGDIVKGQVTEITSKEIKYKKASNINGPVYIEDKSNILSISYSNGEVDKFVIGNNVPMNHTATSKEEGLIELKSNGENDSIIKLYKNCRWERCQEVKGKFKKRTCDTYWAFREGTILRNEDFEILFEDKFIYDRDFRPFSTRIRIKNKTNVPLYVDLANSFRVLHGDATPFYDANSYSSNTGGGKSISLGLGTVTSLLGLGGPIETLANGIGVGSSSGSSSTKIYNMERIITIPPFSSVLMPGRKKVIGKDVMIYYEGINEEFRIEMQDNDERIFDEKDDLSDNNKYGYYITYSKNPDFKNYHIIPILFYPWRFSTGKWRILEGNNWKLIKGEPFGWSIGNFTEDSQWDYKKNFVRY